MTATFIVTVETSIFRRKGRRNLFGPVSEEEQRDNNWSTFNNPLMYRFLHENLRIAEENNKPLTEEYLRKSKRVVDIIGVAFTTTWGSQA
jgi:hypothetical protein